MTKEEEFSHLIERLRDLKDKINQKDVDHAILNTDEFDDLMNLLRDILRPHLTPLEKLL